MSKYWRWQLYFVATECNNAEKLLKTGIASYLTAHPELASSEVRLGVTCEGDWRAFALFVSNFERVEFVTLMRDMVQDANPQLTIRTTKPLNYENLREILTKTSKPEVKSYPRQAAQAPGLAGHEIVPRG